MEAGVNDASNSSNESSASKPVIVKTEDIDDMSSDDEIVPSAIVEPVFLKDPGDDFEFLEFKEDQTSFDNQDIDKFQNKSFPFYRQPWAPDTAAKTLRELRMRAATAQLSAIRTRRRVQLMHGYTGINRTITPQFQKF